MKDFNKFAKIYLYNDILTKLKPYGYYPYNTSLNNHNAELNKNQKIVLNSFSALTNNKNILCIKKNRQNGITSFLNATAIIYAMNGEKVLYYADYINISGYNNIKQISTHNKTILSEKDIKNEKYDLIIIDEIISLKNIEANIDILKEHLNEDGKIIISVTPVPETYKNYKTIYELLNSNRNDIIYCKTNISNNITKMFKKEGLEKELEAFV